MRDIKRFRETVGDAFSHRSEVAHPRRQVERAARAAPSAGGPIRIERDDKVIPSMVGLLAVGILVVGIALDELAVAAPETPRSV